MWQIIFFNFESYSAEISSQSVQNVCSPPLTDCLSASRDGTSGPLRQKVIIHSLPNIISWIIDMSPVFLHLLPVHPLKMKSVYRLWWVCKQNPYSYDGVSRAWVYPVTGSVKISQSLFLNAHLILGKQQTSCLGLYGAEFLLLRRVRQLKHKRLESESKWDLIAEVGEPYREYVGARKKCRWLVDACACLWVFVCVCARGCASVCG